MVGLVKNKLHNLIGSFDVCFSQEHWLLHDQLYLLKEFHPSTSISGVDGSVSQGRIQSFKRGGAECAASHTRSHTRSAQNVEHAKIHSQLNLGP